jgi:hypothetical protein
LVAVFVLRLLLFVSLEIILGNPTVGLVDVVRKEARRLLDHRAAVVHVPRLDRCPVFLGVASDLGGCLIDQHPAVKANLWEKLSARLGLLVSDLTNLGDIVVHFAISHKVPLVVLVGRVTHRFETLSMLEGGVTNLVNPGPGDVRKRVMRRCTTRRARVGNAYRFGASLEEAGEVRIPVHTPVLVNRCSRHVLRQDHVCDTQRTNEGRHRTLCK